MKIALDLDNTITASQQSIKFFGTLSNLLIPAHHQIIILTNREPGTEQEVSAELNNLNIAYSEIIITAEKSDYIEKHSIEVFFEDTDEYFLSLPENVLVFKIRESGNFDFAEKTWIV